MGFGPLLRLVPHLESIQFTEDGGTPDAAPMAAMLVSLSPTLGLRKLTLSWPKDAEGRPLAKKDEERVIGALSGMISLRELSARGFWLEAPAVAHILYNLTGLQHLDLSMNHEAGFRGGRAEALAPALAQLTGLTCLHFQGSGLFPMHAGERADFVTGVIVAFASGLSSLTRLKDLDLSRNWLKHHTLPACSGALEALRHSFPRSLTSLRLDSIFESPEVMALVVPGLSRLTRLR